MNIIVKSLILRQKRSRHPVDRIPGRFVYKKLSLFIVQELTLIETFNCTVKRQTGKGELPSWCPVDGSAFNSMYGHKT